MKRPAIKLPDIDDDAEFAARLNPLASAIVPGISNNKILGNPTVSNSESLNIRNTVVSNKRISEYPVILEGRKPGTSRQSTASRRDEIEAKRGPKKRYEYVLPVRVGDALAQDARERGVSATVRLLEVLRDSGYPVILEDLLDLRLERGGEPLA